VNGWGVGLVALLHAVFQRVNLLLLQGVQLVLQTRESELLCVGHQILARKVQFLGKFEQPDLFVFLFRLGILLQAELLLGCSEHPVCLRTCRGLCRNGRFRPE
jgi:hypothetical protein